MPETVTLPEATRRRIRGLMGEQRVSARELGRRSGVSHTTVSNLLAGNAIRADHTRPILQALLSQLAETGGDDELRAAILAMLGDGSASREPEVAMPGSPAPTTAQNFIASTDRSGLLLETRLRRRLGQHILPVFVGVSGPPDGGVSSALLQGRALAKELHMAVAPLDCTGLADRATFLDNLAHQLATALGLKASAVVPEMTAHGPPSILRYLREYRERAGGPPLLLVVDHLSKASSSVARDVTNFFNAAQPDREALNMSVLVGWNLVAQWMWTAREESLGFEQIELGWFTHDNVTSLLRVLHVDLGFADSVFDMFGGQPLVTQAAAFELADGAAWDDVDARAANRVGHYGAHLRRMERALDDLETALGILRGRSQVGSNEVRRRALRDLFLEPPCSPFYASALGARVEALEARSDWVAT